VAQFQVYRLPGGPLVIDLQSNLIDTGSRVVAPLVPATGELKPITRLEPVFEVEGQQYSLHAAEVAAIPAGFTRVRPVADLSSQEYAIRGALDMLFSGF
jgi:toxin CcdB